MTDRPMPERGTARAEAALRWGLAFVFLFFGIAKFAAYEAEGVSHIAGTHPLLSWLYPLFGVRGASNAIGAMELATAAALIAGQISARVAMVGGAMGVCTFLITLSFAFGAPLWQPGYGFPFIGDFAQFLFKDAGLLVASYAVAMLAAQRVRQSR